VVGGADHYEANRAHAAITTSRARARRWMGTSGS
jgi:hypothetical protein